jgi:carotene epsilon-monooxygenase
VHHRFIPFSGGPRKCVGDQFALLEAIVALAIFLQKINFELVPDQNIRMTTGATIHTTDVIIPYINHNHLQVGNLTMIW